MPGYIMVVNLAEVWPLFIVAAVIIAFVVFVTLDTKRQIERAKKAKAEKEARIKKDNKEKDKRRHIMTFDLAKDLPVLILVGIFVFFIICGAISSRKEEKKDKENEDKKQNQKK